MAADYNIPNTAGSLGLAKAEEALMKATIQLIQLQQHPDTRNDFTGKINQTVTADKPLYTSDLGTPVMAVISFDSVTYTDTKGKVKTTPDQYYDTVLLTVSQAKKIITTEIQGRDGTVKEYIGLDDYAVQIDGIIVGKNGSYPGDAVAALKQLLDAPVAIPVVCKYLNDLGIQSLVIKDYTIAQEAGGYSKQAFTIDALSEIPVELQIL
jgi:hypothetical protein